MKLLNGVSDWKVSANLKASQQFPVHIIQAEKWPDIVAWSDLKEACPHGIDSPLGRKPGGSTRAEEKLTDARHCVPTAWKRVGYAM